METKYGCSSKIHTGGGRFTPAEGKGVYLTVDLYVPHDRDRGTEWHTISYTRIATIDRLSGTTWEMNLTIPYISFAVRETGKSRVVGELRFLHKWIKRKFWQGLFTQESYDYFNNIKESDVERYEKAKSTRIRH